MAGGHMKYRHLGRDSAHRQHLLRNLVTSLITHESIATTWPKAKEAQRLAEKLIQLGKKNTEASRQRAQAILYTPEKLLPKVFGPLRERYAERNGGYTRVLRIPPKGDDQAPSAILELVDGPRDMRFAMTAMTLARLEMEGESINDITNLNIKKVTQYKKGGEELLAKEVKRILEELKKEQKEGKEGSEVN
ncbi:hypothetical protein KEM54_003797 [Ascosphaera aggregata]|nr:hypothetical protein KEM54_003797 [Ascosphaera aggregata]